MPPQVAESATRISGRLRHRNARKKPRSIQPDSAEWVLTPVFFTNDDGSATSHFWGQSAGSVGTATLECQKSDRRELDNLSTGLPGGFDLKSLVANHNDAGDHPSRRVA